MSFSEEMSLATSNTILNLNSGVIALLQMIMVVLKQHKQILTSLMKYFFSI